MTKRDPIKIRLELARGHWLLGEHEESLACLERLVAAQPHAEGLAELIDELLAGTAVGIAPELAGRLTSLHGDLSDAGIEAAPPGPVSPFATATMARLLAEQGHADRAAAVAAEVLRGNPDSPDAREILERTQGDDDPRLRVVERLEHWLERIRLHGRREAQA